MATFLDISLLENFRGIFTWLVVWIIGFGLLEVASPLGEDKKGLHSLIAVALAFLVVLSAPVKELVEFIVPWLTVLGIAAFFLMFALLAFGYDISTVHSWTSDNMKTWIVILGVVIIIFGLSGALGGSDQPQQTPAQTVPANATSGLSGQNQQYGGQYAGGQQSGLSGNYQQGAYPNDQPGAPQTTQQQDESFGNTLVQTFTHPKVLGLIFILLLANFTIGFLTKAAS